MNQDSPDVSELKEVFRVEALKKAFALMCGWPKVQQYGLTESHWGRLREIPGSFAAEKLPEGCPEEDPIRRAQYDLLPHLLEEGREGKWLAFGYGRKWYALGKDAEEAKTNVMIQFPYQMPVLACVILPEVMETYSAKQYYSWTLARSHRPEEWEPATGPILDRQP